MPHSLSNSHLPAPKPSLSVLAQPVPVLLLSAPTPSIHLSTLSGLFSAPLCSVLLPYIAPYHLCLSFSLVSFASPSFPSPFTLFQWFPVFLFSSIIHILLHCSLSCLHPHLFLHSCRLPVSHRLPGSCSNSPVPASPYLVTPFQQVLGFIRV